MMHFIIMKTEDGSEFYFVLRAANNKVVVTSETYKTKQAAKKGIRAVKRASLWSRTIDNAT